MHQFSKSKKKPKQFSFLNITLYQFSFHAFVVHVSAKKKNIPYSMRCYCCCFVDVGIPRAPCLHHTIDIDHVAKVLKNIYNREKKKRKNKQKYNVREQKRLRCTHFITLLSQTVSRLNFVVL